MTGEDRCEPCSHGRGTPIAAFAYSDREKAVLAIARYYFTSFAAPEQQGWIAGISTALSRFGDVRGPEIAVAVLAAVQTMRRARLSTFRFNAPDCPVCATYVTPHEQTLMSALRAIARYRYEAAQGHAALLCESNESRPLLNALDTLADRAFERPEPVTAPRSPAPQRSVWVGAETQG
ncbi:MAG: hypothetical protein AAGC92_00170 [Pseudomonadota bacterium]